MKNNMKNNIPRKFLEDTTLRRLLNNKKADVFEHYLLRNTVPLCQAGSVSEELIPKLPAETPHGPQMPAD
jgi:hypothetical protein